MDTSNWIENLDLSVRTYNRLKKAGMGRIDQLEKVTDAELLYIPGFGPKMLQEVRERIALYRGQKSTEQGECQQPQPKIWYASDRERAKQASGPLGRAYIEELEIIVRLADAFWMERGSQGEDNKLVGQLLTALGRVNFLSKEDDPQASAGEEEELPREVIFS